MSKASSRDVLLERTTDAEVFQDMDNFALLNDSNYFALSLRLQFAKFSKGFSSSDFEAFIDCHIGESNLVSLGRLSFPNEWQMEVKSKDIRERLIRMGRTKINTRTCWISPLSQSEVRGFIHWIPSAIPNSKLEEILRAFGEILLMENQKQSKWKTKIQSDSRYFGLYLKSGKTMDDLPHFIRIDNFSGLVTIRGRSPCCFHCKQPGHRKAECKVYKEKISDYSLRPAGGGLPRYKPRGKRYRKQWQTKKVDQEVQTFTTCSECIRERLEAESAKAEANATLVAKGIHHPDGGTGHLDVGSGATNDAAEGDSVVIDMMSLTFEDTVQPGFWRKVREEKKRLRLAREEERLTQFRARVKAACRGPVQELANAGFSVIDDNKAKAQESASSPKSGEDQAGLTQEPKAAETCGTEEKKIALGPLGQLELLQKNIYDAFASAKETVDLQMAAARQVLQAHAAEEKSASAKKRKRQKKKKAAGGPQNMA